jgi:hypothetical protein
LSVTPSVATQLQPHLTGVALDLVFASAHEFNGKSQPSAALVRSKYSSLNAESATALVRVLTDTDLIDFVASKEKRKTVRTALACNPNLHPVTRLFLLQEGLRVADWDIIRATTDNMPSDMLLETWLGDPEIRSRYIRDRTVLAALLSTENLDLATRVLSTAKSDNSYFITGLFEENTDRTMKLLDRIGYDLNSLPFRDLKFSSDAGASVVTRILEISGSYRQTLTRRLVETHTGDLAFFEFVDPKLLTLAIQASHRQSESDVEVIVRNGLVPELLNAALLRISSSTADTLMSVPLGVRDRALLALLHPDFTQAAKLVERPDIIIELLAENERIQPNRFVVGVSPYLPSETVYALLPAMVSISVMNLVELSRNMKVSVDTLLATFPPEVLLQIDSIPAHADRHQYLARARTLGNDHLCRTALSLSSETDLCNDMLRELVEILSTNNYQQNLSELLIRMDHELATELVPTYREHFVHAYLDSGRNRYRAEWVDLIIDEIRPSTGWAHLNHLTAPAVQYLTTLIGDDSALWETVLGLYENWTGTLDELVEASRNL